MKKVLVLGGFALLAMASCKKEYTCECTSTTAGISATAATTIKDTKKKATEACEAGTTSSTVLGITSSVSCEIK
jgi:hypothetical protein